MHYISVDDVNAMKLSEIESSGSFDEFGLGGVGIGITERSDDNGGNVAVDRKTVSKSRMQLFEEEKTHMNWALTPRTAEVALS